MNENVETQRQFGLDGVIGQPSDPIVTVRASRLSNADGLGRQVHPHVEGKGKTFGGLTVATPHIEHRRRVKDVDQRRKQLALVRQELATAAPS